MRSKRQIEKIRHLITGQPPPMVPIDMEFVNRCIRFIETDPQMIEDDPQLKQAIKIFKDEQKRNNSKDQGSTAGRKPGQET